jgi:hypothetical protein
VPTSMPRNMELLINLQAGRKQECKASAPSLF